MIRIDIHTEPCRHDYARIEGDDVAEVLAAYTIVKQALAPTTRLASRSEPIAGTHSHVMQTVAEQVAQRLNAKVHSMKEDCNQKSCSDALDKSPYDLKGRYSSTPSNPDQLLIQAIQMSVDILNGIGDPEELQQRADELLRCLSSPNAQRS